MTWDHEIRGAPEVACAEDDKQSSVTASVTDLGKGVYKVRLS